MATTAYADRFSAEEAFLADEEGEPIIISQPAAKRIVGQHGGEGWDEFERYAGKRARYNAWTVFEWLGY